MDPKKLGVEISETEKKINKAKSNLIQHFELWDSLILRTRVSARDMQDLEQSSPEEVARNYVATRINQM